ncbi:MAG: histidinol-phosphate transaminase [Neptuniibacter caesariensis]|uniref:Histidinol-phosphate aminotransferase n=1 Tax=Neptuniibacter caesariensis TaxID=207954 RepID=A0A2G6JKL2_NEPCE|nr:MAG: histidinol-phosphate transaminase [Neptuniibacter caesariensis]
MSCDFIALATKGVQNLNPYLPGKPPEELERELGLTGVVKLASNENPLGLSEKAEAAIRGGLHNLALYPDSGGYRLKQALAERFGFAADQVTLGNGSNDVLELIARAYLNPGDEVIYSEYAFVVYSLVTQATNATAVVTQSKDWGHDLIAMQQAITDKTRIIFIANPNNPTGTWLGKTELCAFLDQVPENVLVVLDEAYTEYVKEPDFVNGLDLLKAYPNLIVTRTFSKAYGLAGLRVGYSVSNVDIANILSRVRQPFNVNSLALLAAEAVLTDEQYLERAVAVNTAGMAFYEQQLAEHGFDFIPSVGNFITVDLKQDAMPIYQSMLQQGVIVRPVANYAMPHHLRISIGLAEENERCMDALIKAVDQS